MAGVVVAEAARHDLARLIRSNSLPPTTHDRLRRALEPLATFPFLGPALSGRWRGFRFMLGPWPWMVIVYVYDETEDVAIVVTIQDARTANAARSDQSGIG